MSRIGNKIVVLPAGVEIKQDGNDITVKGPKGELKRTFSSDIKMNIEGNEVTFTRPNDSKEMKTIHGTTRALLNNMVGYRAQLQGKKLVLNVGYSHPVEIEAPAGIEIEVPSNTSVIIKGSDKEVVGELAANIRGVRPPEPYKGKGIRYVGEFVRRKEGKTGK